MFVFREFSNNCDFSLDIKAKKLIKNVFDLFSLCYYKNVELKGDLLWKLLKLVLLMNARQLA